MKMNTQTRTLHRLLTPILVLVLAFSALGISPTRADSYVPATTAIRVYGQGGSMTTGDPEKDGPSANSLYFPTGLTLDSNGLYVIDAFNNRVLNYPASSTSAAGVYGQGGDFTTITANKGGISADSLFFVEYYQALPTGLAVDSSGGLYVTDTANNRVLYYPSGSTTATRVYGQGGSFTTNDTHWGTSMWDLSFCYDDSTLGANSLNHPGGLALDSNDNLYVADTGNSRVLYYPSGSTTATRVYGHGGDFTYCFPNIVSIDEVGPNANSLYQPIALALDSSGNLYVADTYNNRVLYYPAGSTTATRVYGQAGDFTANTANNGGVSANSLNTPTGLALDSNGDLFVSDSANHRVLYYPANIIIATQVYGQDGSFSSNTANNGGISADSLYYPTGLALDSSGNLFVADTINSRVLEYPVSSTSLGTPVMVMTGNNNFIYNGNVTPSTENGTDFGNAGVRFGIVNTFTIYNNGTGNLNLTDYALVTISGPNAGDFSLIGTPPSSPIGPGDSTTFTLQFTPSATGLRSATVNIGNDDSAHNPFTFAIQGTGFQASPTTAIRVYGQGGSMTTGDPEKDGFSANSLYFPMGLTLDSSGLYVIDALNNRVLYYPAGSTTAARVYGQGGDFTTITANKGGISANSLYLYDNSPALPTGLAVDSSGGLYVTDTANNRVLYYPSGSTTATRVYGQGGSFTTNDIHVLGGSIWDITICYDDPTLGANSLFHPGGLALDSNDNLYVADTGDSRVLYYPSGSTTATRVYGHDGDFTYCFPNIVNMVEVGPNANSLYQPLGLALDSNDNLYVADTSNNRVLYYPSGSTTATRVYGQGGDFTANTANNNGVSATSLNTPTGLALDSNGNLFVSDAANHRVMYYPAGNTTATQVYGQGGDFSSNSTNNGGISADSLYFPSGLALDSSGNLYVADTANSRVLGFASPTPPESGTPAIALTGKSHSIANGSDSPSSTNGTDFGVATTPFGVASQTFAIFNTGTGNLNLTGYPRVSISGPNAGDFSLIDPPPSSPVAPGGSWTLFTVQFHPTAMGTRSATISIDNDDSANDPYTFAIQGTGSSVPSVTTGTADAVTSNGATLHGMVNANYGDATVTFRYGEDALDHTVTALESPVSGEVDTPVSAAISGLKPATLYHYRVYATNLGGTTRGEDGTFTSGCYPSVTVTSDVDDGAGSLRQAIADVCPGGTIDFDSSLSAGTILLSTSLYPQKNLTIDGSGLDSQITLSGDHAVRIFTIPSGVTATLEGLKIVDGTSVANGGGIFNMGMLTVKDSTLSGNTAVNNAGGIANGGTLTVTGSTLIDNHADSYGGGIWSENYNVKVINSTLKGNSAGWYGGGIYLRSGSLTLLNSTLSGNSAVASGGGGLNISGTLNYANTIIAASTGGDCVSSTIGINLNNLVEDSSCSASLSGDPKLVMLADNGGPTWTMALAADSPTIDAGDYTTCTSNPVNGLDQRGEDRTTVSLKCDIGAFEVQAGQDTTPPVVDSFAATSPSSTLDIPITAFTAHDDTGVTGYLITDSTTPPPSGDPGWITPAPDKYTVSATGAYTLYPWAVDAAGNVSAVFGSPSVVMVCYPTITITNDADSGPGTLRQAITDLCPGGTITVADDTTITLASMLVLSKDMTIDGSDHTVTVDGNNSLRVFQVNFGVEATLISLNITNGNAAGGGIYNNGTLTVSNSMVSGNNASSYGGGIGNYGTLTVSNSTISNNRAGKDGGGIDNNGTLTILNSTISGNNAARDGGGIHSLFGDLTISNSTISGNNAAGDAGGIYYNADNLTLMNSTLVENQASGNFNGLWLQSGSLSFANTIIASSASGLDCLSTGTFSLNLNNLVQDGSCSSGAVNFKTGDPLLASLQDNDGPTWTMALLPDSPALDAGDVTTCADWPVGGRDQRGITRPQGAHCDIGAYETSPSTTSVTFEAGPYTYRGTPFTATAIVTGSSGLNQNLTVSYSGDCTNVSTGGCSASASFQGDATHTASSDTESITIAKTDQTITFPAITNKAYGGVDFDPGASASSGLAVSYSSSGDCTIVSGKVHLTGAGNCTVTASQAGDDNYNAALDVSSSFSIDKADQSITFPTIPDKTYLDPDFDPGASSSSGLEVSYSFTGNCAIVSGKIHMTGAGNCTVTASQDGNDEFNPAQDLSHSFTINKASQTITFPTIADKTYGDVDFDPGANPSSGLVVSYSASGNCSILSSKVHLTGTGSCTVTASQAGNDNYNAALDVSHSFSIAKADQTITFPTIADKTYGGADFDPGASASSGLAVAYSAFGDCTILNGKVRLTGAGNCTVTASQAGDNNYNAALDVSRSFSITKADQTITFPTIADKTYGGADFDPGASASSGLAVAYSASGDCTILNGKVHLTGAGNCTVTASQAGDDNYNAALDVSRSFSIAKATLTVTPDPRTLSAQYSDANPSTFAPSYSGWIGTDGSDSLTTKPTCSTSRTVDSPAGIYSITCSEGADDNYSFTYINGTFTVTQEDAKVTFASDNPAAMQVSTPGGSLAGNALSLIVTVQEKQPDVPLLTSAAAGDINNAGLTVTLTPLSGGSAIPLNCTSSVSGSGYDAINTFTCGYGSALPIDTYDVTATVTGNYYTTPVAYDGFTVYDPSQGYATGGGWFYWPDTVDPSTGYPGDKTNFGFVMKYNKSGTSPKGSLIIVRHFADGTIARLKSNALTTLAIKTSGMCGTATLSGKATYMAWDVGTGTYVNTGGIPFTVYASDCNNPGTGNDSFWVRSTGNLTMPGTGSDGAIVISGGNIAIPHTTGKKK
jgi:hypothetical protein